MRTRIISAFPGTGKTHFTAANPDRALDSDSSHFSWSTDADGKKCRHPDWPSNYVKHIQENIGKVEFIFVSTHKEVRDALRDHCLFFYLVYPNSYEDVKAEYLRRYKQRGSPQAFLDLVDKEWSNWLTDLIWDDGCRHVRMGRFSYLDDNLDDILLEESPRA